jgi:BolA family transcriptional regulator, general stress-responsive regulator
VFSSRIEGGKTDMAVKDEIEARLTAAFTPDRLEVVNESHQHSGHSGDDGSGESHFRVVIRAAAFAPMSRVARHRAVHQALGDLNQRVHAIALDVG